MSSPKTGNWKEQINKAEIARKLGKSRTFISLVVHGHKKSRLVAEFIERELGVSPGSLFSYLKGK